MERINIMIGRFQPLTNGHMACVQEAFIKKGVKTIICMIGVSDEKVDEKHPFPSSMLLPMYQNIFNKNKMVEDIVLVKNADIVKIGEMLWDMGYEIVSWTCGTDRLSSYQKMAEKYADKAHLPADFEMIEVKRSDEDISATKVRQALIEDDYKYFASMTPLITLQTRLKNVNYYETLRNQILKVYKS